MADKPKEGLPKCIAGPLLLAQIVVCKFTDSLPLRRLEGILKRCGVDIPRSSMCRWVQQLAEMCCLLLALMKQEIFKSDVIQADETPVKQQVKGKRRKLNTSYFTSYLGDKNNPYTIYGENQKGREQSCSGRKL